MIWVVLIAVLLCGCRKEQTYLTEEETKIFKNLDNQRPHYAGRSGSVAK